MKQNANFLSIKKINMFYTILLHIKFEKTERGGHSSNRDSLRLISKHWQESYGEGASGEKLSMQHFGQIPT